MSAIHELSPSSRPGPPREADRPASPPAATDDAPSAFSRLVHGFSREADRGEATVRGVLGPRGGPAPLDPTTLLALQAGIYRYGETMDLAARLVDKASSGVKTVIQGQ